MPQYSPEGSEPMAHALAERVSATHGDRSGWVCASRYAANIMTIPAIFKYRTMWMLGSACHNSRFAAARASGARKVTQHCYGR